MSFGQVSGPPATAKQLRELLDLLEAAGHSDFRDARGPMGFTQRQAGGKFSRDEAQAFIDQLEAEAEGSTPAPVPSAASAARPKAAKVAAPSSAPVARPKASAAAAPTAKDTPARPSTPMERALRAATSDQLADELRRRGWRSVER